MTKLTSLAALSIGAILVLGACDAGLVGGFTVGGTVSGSYIQISSDAAISLTDGTTTVSVTVPLSTVQSYQSGTYSLAHVPQGDYTITVTFDDPYSYSGFATYSILGGVQGVHADSDGSSASGPPYRHTIIFSNVQVGSDETIDVDLGNIG